MDKLNLPEQLKDWKVLSPVPDAKGYPSFNIERTEFDGSKTKSMLTYVCFEGDDYSSENIDLVNEEAAFIKSLIKIPGVSNYYDVVVENEPSENRISLYILTNDAQPLMKILGGKRPDDNEIVDFGLQVSEILEKLEKNNILHGNLKPEHVFINADGKLLLSGFTAFDSNAQDLSYTAPEMYAGEQPDYTTDIYSLGLMMYTMANGGKLPFEENGASRSAATEKRFSKIPVPAPSGGNDKLKSVIVIACQPEKKDRWKNAGNIKNALASIKAELPAQAPPVRKPVQPENTAFESNVFEEFAFDEFDETPAPVKTAPTVAGEKTAHELAQGAAVASSAAALNSQLSKEANDNSQGGDSSEIDNGVFDDYEGDNLNKTRVFRLNNSQNSPNSYGDLFEDEIPKNRNDQDDPYDRRDYYGNPRDDEYDDDQEPAQRSKSFIIGIIVVIAAVILALAGFAVFAAQNGWFSGNSGDKKTEEPTVTVTASDATAATVAPATKATEAATVPETTAEEVTEPTETEEPTTVPIDAEITPLDVTGFYYDYAEIVLKDQGFNVEIQREDSSDVERGFVISMSPDSSAPVKYGSTITLIVSNRADSGSSDGQSSASSDDQSSTTAENNEGGENNYSY